MSHATQASSFPLVDEHIVEPETREELVRGERVLSQPAPEQRAERHFNLNYVLCPHVAPGFVGSTGLLTRVAHDSDFASDTCIRRAGEDPETGGRYLEELAFQVVFEQPLKQVSERAEDLSRRGVRRVLAIFVETARVGEWVPEARAWRELDPEGSISDPCLIRPFAVRALFDDTVADDEVWRALEAQGNPVIVAIKTESKKERQAREEALGEARGARREAARAVLTVLTRRRIEVPARVRAAIEGSTDLVELERWLDRALIATSADEVINDP